MRFPQGHVIGERFVIDAWVGEGGMASVYRAHEYIPAMRAAGTIFSEALGHRSLGRALLTKDPERLQEARAEIPMQKPSKTKLTPFSMGSTGEQIT